MDVEGKFSFILIDLAKEWHKMKMQAVYNKIKKHLLTQNKQAFGIGPFGVTACLYFAPDGCKCAIGCLIKKKYYNSDLEGHSVTYPSIRNALQLSGVDLNSDENITNLLDCLRNIHDHYPPKTWKKEIVKLAKEFKLKS